MKRLGRWRGARGGAGGQNTAHSKLSDHSLLISRGSRLSTELHTLSTTISAQKWRGLLISTCPRPFLGKYCTETQLVMQFQKGIHRAKPFGPCVGCPPMLLHYSPQSVGLTMHRARPFWAMRSLESSLTHSRSLSRAWPLLHALPATLRLVVRTLNSAPRGHQVLREE